MGEYFLWRHVCLKHLDGAENLKYFPHFPLHINFLRVKIDFPLSQSYWTCYGTCTDGLERCCSNAPHMILSPLSPSQSSTGGDARGGNEYFPFLFLSVLAAAADFTSLIIIPLWLILYHRLTRASAPRLSRRLGVRHVWTRLWRIYTPFQSPESPFICITLSLAHSTAMGQNIKKRWGARVGRDMP